MLISRKLISVFKGIYNEYGPNVTLNRLCNLLKLNIGQVDVDSITFTDKSIIINCKTPILIVFEDDYIICIHTNLSVVKCFRKSNIIILW